MGSAPPGSRKHGDDPQRDLLLAGHLRKRLFRFLSRLGEQMPRRRFITSTQR